jgi:lysophospholipase L1-like esterase
MKFHRRAPHDYVRFRGPRRHRCRLAPERLEARTVLDAGGWVPGLAGTASSTAPGPPAAYPGETLGPDTDPASFFGEGGSDRAQRLEVGDIRAGSPQLRKTPGDYDRDGKSDIAIYNGTIGRFFIATSTGKALTPQLGIVEDINVPVAGDYDGDGKSDFAIYDVNRFQFFIALSSGGVLSPRFGIPAHINVPVAGDFDGDGKTDIAIYDLSDSTFHVALSRGGGMSVPFGSSAHSNEPVAGDYDGDGRIDIAIYDRTAARFFIRESSGKGLAPLLGVPGDENVPVVGDFDGDGRTDVAIYDRSRRQFTIAESGGGELTPKFGRPDDTIVPVAGDYDGDGKADLAVYDVTARSFLVAASSGGPRWIPFGARGYRNVPLPASTLDPGLPSAVNPVPGRFPTPSLWLAHHDEHANKEVRGINTVVFFGDSITYGWGADAFGTNGQLWNTWMAPLGAVNYGIAGDLTENLLWRVQHGELAGHPRVVVVMIGTNNLGLGAAPADVAHGIAAVVSAIRADSPGTTVLLLSILPRPTVPSSLIAQVNAGISRLDDGAKTRFLDLTPAFSRPDGSPRMDLLKGTVHLNTAGYQVLTAWLYGPIKAALSRPTGMNPS